MSRRPPVRLVLLVATAGALLVASLLLDVGSFILPVLDWVRDQGAIGVAIFGVVYIAATVLFVPGSLLTLGAGLIYGVVWGTVYVSLASTAGATAAFLVGRYLARDWIASRVAGSARFSAIDAAVGREGWKIVGLTRLSPVFPFNLLNYAYGLTKVPLSGYFWASWIGMLPGTVMYVYIGSLAGDLATLGADGRARTTAEWVLYGVGFVATVAVTLLVTRIARRTLSARVDAVSEHDLSNGERGDSDEENP